MQTTLENIKDMVDVNTVIGEPIEAGNGSTIIPISKVSFGFVAGGGDYHLSSAAADQTPFAGGSGAAFPSHREEVREELILSHLYGASSSLLLLEE